MTSKDTFTKDIDLIKEFESLKLKQMILVESLKNSKDTSKNYELTEEIFNKISLALNSNVVENNELEELNLYKRIERLENSLEKILNILEKNESSKEKEAKNDEEEVPEEPPIPKF